MKEKKNDTKVQNNPTNNADVCDYTRNIFFMYLRDTCINWYIY